MTTNFRYPSCYEMQQAITEFCQRRFMDEFLRERGVFITHATQDDLAEFVSGLLLEYGELDQIRSAALQSQSRSTMSGFLILSDDDEFNLVDFLDRRRGTEVDPKTKMRLGPVTSSTQVDGTSSRGQVEYTQWRPGRIQFLQGTERSFDYYVHQERSRVWRILVDCDRSNDVRLMENWLGSVVPRESRLAKIDEGNLSSLQTVKFFDELATQGTQRDWRFVQVKRLVLRRAVDDGSSTSDDEEEIDRETDGMEVAAEVLSGISQAILEGNDLRHNAFVKQSESGGYRFTAMSYEYEELGHAHVIRIRAEFKRKPKVFEVAVESYKRRVGTEEKLEDATMSLSDRITLLSQFWRVAKRVYDDLIVEIF